MICFVPLNFASELASCFLTNNYIQTSSKQIKKISLAPKHCSNGFWNQDEPVIVANFHCLICPKQLFWSLIDVFGEVCNDMSPGVKALHMRDEHEIEKSQV